MDILSLLFLAAALAMDAFSAAVTDGMIVKKIRFYDGFATDIVERFDHWIAFVLLGFLGLHMIWESRTEQEIPKNPLKNSSLLLAAIATSIDALAAGVTLAAVDTPILFSSAVIGITAFLFSFGGVFIGKKFGGFLGSKAECIGGIILILIGVKTLVEHLY